MKKEKIFTFDFDVSKVNAIRLTLDERSVFTSNVRRTVRVKKLNGGKTDNSIIPAFDTIYVALNRIEDTLLYINTLELGRKKKINEVLLIFLIS